MVVVLQLRLNQENLILQIVSEHQIEGLACGVYSAPRTKDTIFVGASNYVANYPLESGMLTSIESLLKASMEQINSSFIMLGFIGTKLDGVQQRKIHIH